MKILTTNFLTCAVKSCKTSPQSYPLHFRDAQLERSEIDFQPLFLRNILPRVNWDALKTTASELGLSALVPESNPSDTAEEVEEEEEEEEDGGEEATVAGGVADEMIVEADNGDDGKFEKGQQTVEDEEATLKRLHQLLLETSVIEGKLVCANCQFEYPIKEGVGNFLLPAHLV